MANAVQHGNASRINIKIERTPDHVQLGIVDNGSGLPGILGTYSEAALLAQGVGPQSICKRITELRGTLSLFSSRQGVELFIGLPLDDQAAHKISDKAHAFG